MGATKGNITYMRFNVKDFVPGINLIHAAETWSNGVWKNAFQPIDRDALAMAESLEARAREERKRGWTTLEDPYDADFLNNLDSFLFDHGLVALTFCADQIRLSSRLLEVETEKAILKKEEERGCFLLKKGRKALKDEVKRVLLPKEGKITEGFTEMVFDTSGGTVRFWSSSKSLADNLWTDFDSSFGLRLEVADPFSLAVNHIQQRFISSEYDPQDEEKALEDLKNFLFLGQEFLSWLWWKAWSEDGVFNLSSDTRVNVQFESYLSLVTQNNSWRVTLKKGGPSSANIMDEAHQLLAKGYIFKAAKLRIIEGNREWSFLLDADRFTFSAVKLPQVFTNNDEDLSLYDRMDLLKEMERYFDSLYGAFLDLRLSPQWESNIAPAMEEYFTKEPESEARAA